MLPETHPNQTHSFGKPSTWNEETSGSCGTLSVSAETTPEGSRLVSLWRPSEEELNELLKGGVVALGIYGSSHPVVSLTTMTISPPVQN